MAAPEERPIFQASPGFRRRLGYVGIVLAMPFFVWLAIGWLPMIPSMIEIFGVPGLRWPTSVTVLGLLIAAVGFWEI